MGRSRFSGAGAASLSSGTSSSIDAPVLSLRFAFATRPSTFTAPSSISFWRRERDWPATIDARKRSRRWPSFSSDTVTVKGGMSGSLPRPFRRGRAPPPQCHEHDHRQGREDQRNELGCRCLLYTSDAADER